MKTPIRLAALLSGGGRTLLNILERIEDGTIPARVETVIASRKDAPGVERVRARGLEVHVANGREVNELLDETHHDLVCLCGWLDLLEMEPWMRGRVMNIHPALLPAFGGKGMYGRHVHEAVLSSGSPSSGCSVHFVDEHYDHGPVILQRACPVLEGDDAESLAARVFEQECEVYPQAIALFADGRLRLEGDRVLIAPPVGGHVEQDL